MFVSLECITTTMNKQRGTTTGRLHTKVIIIERKTRVVEATGGPKWCALDICEHRRISAL
ncbi:hypothetical protein Bhyg_04311, partial [Pseudolycoriella hygida]